jgi:uncharacterized 2Fe-2S/4Fe-4S cluster protein (DUF4445 family)
LTFEPEGRRVKTALGITIFQAAREAGISIRSECGGKGVCGKCRVIVQDKNSLNEVTATETKHLSSSEINSGYRLACQSFPKRNVKIMIPPESRIGARKIQITGLERPVPLNPLVEKFHLALPKPTLFDVTPDFERLLESMKNTYGFERLEINYRLLTKLPSILRNANWDVTVTLWDNRKVIAVEKGDTSDKLFGLAIDIGTSKIVGYLVDLRTGKTLDISSIENPQVFYGEDILSRITFAMRDDEKLEELQKLVIEGINDVIHKVCVETNVNPSDVYEATVVGNTAMHHLFLAIQPKYLALSPYTPAVRRGINICAKELNIKMNPYGNVHVLPVIAGFVGADAVADVLASGIYDSEELSLLIDIGTNAEIFIGNTEDILCCSCASGPAFEGAHIKHGMKATTGAIEKVRIKPNSYEVEYETVDGTKPTGLCGSAVVDIIAELLKCGIINRQGLFEREVASPRLRTLNGDVEFVLAESEETLSGKAITITQRDIGEIQLAKAAIFAGCSILMKRKNLRREDLDRIFIAGAFGSFNPENAKFIGLVPDVPTEKISFVGNTAIAGAKMTLISKEARETAEMLSKKVRYLELAADPDFNQEFFKATFIPHKDLDRFPSIKEYLERTTNRSAAY